MPFSFADDVGSISANRLLKKYKKLRALGNSFIHHTTDSQGQVFKFVMFRGSFENKHALDLYSAILTAFPIVNDKNRKQVDKELDAAILLAEANLPFPQEKVNA